MENREEHFLKKLLGLTGRMRKYQQAYFKHRFESDKKKSIQYERLVDEYIKLLLKSGIKPTFDDSGQQTIFK
jgi:hypothetical protein